MGAAASSFPSHLDYNQAKSIAGERYNDKLFWAYAENGKISTELLLRLSVEHNVYFCNNPNDNKYVLIELCDFLTCTYLSCWMSHEQLTEGIILEHICSAIDRSRVVIFFITTQFLEQAGGNDCTNMLWKEFFYLGLKKDQSQMIAIIITEEAADKSKWPKTVRQTLGNCMCIECFDNKNLTPVFERIYEGVMERVNIP